MKLSPFIAFSIGCSLALTGCIKKADFEAQAQKLMETQKRLDDTTNDLNKANKDLADANQKITEQDDAYKKLAGEKKNTDDELSLAIKRNGELASRLTEVDENVKQLVDENSRKASENESLEKELDNLRRMRAAVEKQNAQYATMLNKLRSMIDAGTLKVTIRKGQMMVQLSNDILFAPGGYKLKKEGKDAIIALAETIREFTDRRFLVVGHSDNAQINTARFPSNWELSSQRAIEVVRILTENGVLPEMLIAAGNAEYDPVAENDTAENKAQNRRVEVIFMPSIEALPSFGEADAN